MEPHISSSYDIAIIGGGPAGILAALSARRFHPHANIVVIDRMDELGKKFCISGGGRGNLTNINIKKNPEQYFHGNQQVIASVFSQFGYEDIVHFFDDLGIALYEEQKTGQGKVYPVINHAKTIRDMLTDLLIEKDINVLYATQVTGLKKDDGGWVIGTNKHEIKAKQVILTSGGKTYPALGSDGSGYEIARSLGHTIIEPIPSAVPLVSKNPFSHYLQGEKVEMRVSPLIDGQEKESVIGDVLFTQYGFSGSNILDVSRDISIRINREKKQDVSIRFCFFPYMDTQDSVDTVQKRFAKHPTRPVSHSLWGLVTEKTAMALCAVSQIPKERIVNDISSEEKKRLIDVLKGFTADISGTRGWNEAEFTVGGVSADEVNPLSLESLKHPGIYFAGEILDVDGPIGGYNLSWAWASGYVAGKMQSL